MLQPMRIAPARAWRTYRGGRLLAALHGRREADGPFPEEWLLSVVSARNPGREQMEEGLSSLEADGSLLRDYIARDPEKILGRGRRETGMLMKLIDAAERLSVQVHPTREDAMRYFHSPFGKTECWHILGGRAQAGQPPCIYLGFRENVSRGKWAALFERQDIDGMLACLHRMPVQAGETYLIHGGVPHAIGAGCFLAEIQEPTDLTLRAERTAPGGASLPDAACHQGIGFEKMLDCFCYDGCSLEEARRRWLIPARAAGEEKGMYRRTSLLRYADTPYFRLEKWEIAGKMTVPARPAYHGFYVLAGRGEICFGEQREPLFPGVQYFVPACAGEYTLCCGGEGLLILCYDGPETKT